MPKKAKVITYFGEFAESDLADASAHIFYCMKQNAVLFKDTPIDLPALKKQLGKFNKLRNSPSYSSKTPDNKKLRKELQRMLKNIGTWLNGMADGDKSILVKSGFPLHELFKSVGVLPQTILKMVALNTAGSLKFLISNIKFQHIRYGIMYTLADNPDNNPAHWRLYYASIRKGVIKDLESGKYYKFASFGMGTNTKLNYSNPVIMRIN